jgi:hypothetical protein
MRVQDSGFRVQANEQQPVPLNSETSAPLTYAVFFDA